MVKSQWQEGHMGNISLTVLSMSVPFAREHLGCVFFIQFG